MCLVTLGEAPDEAPPLPDATVHPDAMGVPPGVGVRAGGPPPPLPVGPEEGVSVAGSGEDVLANW